MTRQKSRKRVVMRAAAAALDLVLATGTVLSVYYCNYLAPVRFSVPASLSASRDAQSPLPGLGSLMSDGLNLGDGVSLTTGDAVSQDGSEMAPVTISGTPADLSGKFADKFSSKTTATASTYQSKDLAISVTQHSFGAGQDQVTYYIADVYTSNLSCFKTYFAKNVYGSGFNEHITDMSADVKAVLAVNGDSYCYNRSHTAGPLIRNGVIYRAEATTSDVCVLYNSGEMRTFSPDQFDLKQVAAGGAYQSWTFGPRLLDDNGRAMTEFNTWDYIRKSHPRTAIGYYEPGHYCLVVVDGRQEGYSRGMTLPELSQLFQDLGCKAAYNLDGGHSTMMAMDGRLVNRPYKDTHEIVDCLYVGEV